MSDRILTVVRCQGEGQSTCHRCTDRGKWSLCWASWFYEISADGFDFPGVYCFDCVHDIADTFKLKIVRPDKGVQS